jgi:hypothetical protein
MKKELLSEISRIHEMMGINPKSIILESRCLVCDLVNKQIDTLKKLSDQSKIGNIVFNKRLNELLEDIKVNSGLSVNQRAGFENAINRLKGLSKESDDIIKQIDNAKKSIRDFSDSMSEGSQTIYDWSNLYKTKEFANDYYKYNPYSKQDILEYENAFETMPEYKGAITLKNKNGEFLYKDFDDYFEKILKPYFSDQLTKQSVDADLIPNLIEKYKTEMTSNPKIGGKWENRGSVTEKVAEDDLPTETDELEIEVENDPAELLRGQRYEKLKKKKDAGKTLNQQENSFYDFYEQVYINKTRNESTVSWDLFELMVKDIKEARKNLNSLLDTGATLGKKYTQTLIEIINSKNAKKATIDDDCAGLFDENGNLIEGIEEMFNDQNKSFLKRLKGEEQQPPYYVTTDENGNWLDINMLTSNKTDRITFFIDYAHKNGYDIQKITEVEINEILKKMSNEKTDLYDDIILDADRYTKTSKLTTTIGDQIESKFKNLFESGPLSNKFEIVWSPPKKGNAIDMHLGIDMIIRDKTSKQLYPVQIKRTDKIEYNTSIAHGGENLRFRLFSGIKLKKGFVGVIDNNDNFLLYPPQDLYIKENDYYVKLGMDKGFNTRPGYNFVDFDGDEFYTNLETPTIKEQKKFIFKNYLFEKYFSDII